MKAPTSRGSDARTSDALDDAALIVAIARQDHDAFAAVYSHYGPRVYGLARRLCDATQAEEILQDVFLGLWLRPQCFDPARGSLPHFLLMQTHGRAVDVLRSEGARRARESTEVGTRPTQSGEIETLAIARVAGEGACRLLAALPNGEREVILLAYFGGLSYRQVANVLDQPEGTVKSRIRSGLARLRLQLADTHRDALCVERAPASKK